MNCTDMWQHEIATCFHLYLRVSSHQVTFWAIRAMFWSSTRISRFCEDKIFLMFWYSQIWMMVWDWISIRLYGPLLKIELKCFRSYVEDLSVHDAFTQLKRTSLIKICKFVFYALTLEPPLINWSFNVIWCLSFYCKGYMVLSLVLSTYLLFYYMLETTML